jgi:hypothetical protein
MLDDLAELYKDREEKVKHGKAVLVVKQWDGSEKKWVFEDPDDIQWRLIERCVFRENGERAFTRKDVDKLRSKPLVSGQLAAAVSRVNGLDLEQEAKNSEAVQG